MKLRIVTSCMGVLTALAISAGAAAASPLPEPPPSSGPHSAVTEAITVLETVYRVARTEDKRSIHNEIVLLINVGSSAL